MAVSCFLIFLYLKPSFCFDFGLDFFCSKRSSGTSSSIAPVPSSSVAPVPSSSGAPVPATPLLPPSGEDVFAAVVSPARSSFGFMKKKIAE